MALEERRTLKEVAILVDRSAINVLWADEIVKDGMVLMSTDHRGAYPLNESGEVDPTVAGLLGGTLEQIIGNVASGLQLNLVSLEAEHSAVLQERENLLVQLQQANDQILTLTQQVSALTAQNVVNEQGAPGDE
jgi:hypothetical protein